ncbi:oxidoreductase-like protein [Ophiostoma piceae UAMH 11346]|uniref:Oxidoreductase-like protein n=1 Tax=Ophiostoma piceae (strain UAMH 11346) TaxID=1262450 RepID=S3BVB1_OPHP1|nr:oxidoreductase-like protein [Ophiostoma piceae UAMH 11346]
MRRSMQAGEDGSGIGADQSQIIAEQKDSWETALILQQIAVVADASNVNFTAAELSRRQRRHRRRHRGIGIPVNDYQKIPNKYNCTMGLLSWSSGPTSDDEKRAEAVRNGAAVPTRAERKKCWDSRDIYFGCLDKHKIIDVTKAENEAAAKKACGAENALIERDCAAQWVAHFKKYRVANYQKEQRLAALRAQGANEVQIQSGPGDTIPNPNARK